MRKKQSRPRDEALCFASRMLADQRIDVAGKSQFTVRWLIAESKSLEQLDKLKDLVSTDWREADEEADELREEIVKTAGTALVNNYDDAMTRGLCAEIEAYFVLGYAAALRLTGR